MRYILVALVVFISSTAFADQYVNSYIRKDGTYVQGHYRSDPDNSTYNNYSTRGNTNPYTGQRGTQDAYRGYKPYNYDYRNNIYPNNNDDSEDEN